MSSNDKDDKDTTSLTKTGTGSGWPSGTGKGEYYNYSAGSKSSGTESTTGSSSSSSSSSSTSSSSKSSSSSYSSTQHYSGSSSSSSYSGGTTYYTSKYMDPTPAFKWNGIEFWGSAKDRLKTIKFTSKDLLVNCTGYAYSITPFSKEVPKWMKLPEIPSASLNQLVLDWTDFKAPPSHIGLDFWKTIIEQAKENGITRIVVCCTAGQGRTGTALTSFALATGATDSADVALEYIRDKYSEHAVESKEQKEYLKEIAPEIDYETSEEVEVVSYSSSGKKNEALKVENEDELSDEEILLMEYYRGGGGL